MDQLQYIRFIAAQLPDLRLDANETAMLDRALRYVEAQVYNVEYPELRHRRYVPTDNSVPPGAESIMYRQFEQVRNAKIIQRSYADDLPRADVLQQEFPIPIKAIGTSFEYSLRDLQAAAFSGVQLDSLRAQAARDSIEFELDDIAAFGREAVSLRGLANNSVVDVISAQDVSGKVTWIGDAKSSKEIISDLSLLTTHIVTETNQIYRPDTILLPTDLFEHIAVMPFGVESDRTVLEWFRQNHPGVTIEGWYKLNAANAAGTGGRILSYLRRPTVLQEKIPMEYTQLPPQARNLAFVVNAWAITGGVHIYRPKAVVYMDGAS